MVDCVLLNSLRTYATQVLRPCRIFLMTHDSDVINKYNISECIKYIEVHGIIFGNVIIKLCS